MGAPLEQVLPYRRAPTSATRTRTRLICLPFAGGNATIYREWSFLLADTDVCAVELPGRGRRINEAPIDAMEPLVERLVDDLAPVLDRPIHLFGHSMGARVAFALARRIPHVRTVTVSGSRAPSRETPKRIADVSDADFVEAISKLNGTPLESLQSAEFRQLVLPCLRADFRIGENYRSGPDDIIDAPMALVIAKDDGHTVPEDRLAWRAHTRGRFMLTELARGGHFFLNTRRDEVLRVVRATLTSA